LIQSCLLEAVSRTAANFKSELKSIAIPPTSQNACQFSRRESGGPPIVRMLE
jgi:hypothetical protein